MQARAAAATPLRNPLAATIAALLLMLFQGTTARLGIDYGSHWDEHFLQSILAESVTELDAWPRKYFYGSLYAGMGYLALAPDWIGALPQLIENARTAGQYHGRLEPNAEMQKIQQTLRERIYEPAFLIRARSLFALAASLGVLALFLAGSRLGSRPGSGVAAAAVLALSWEFNTHSRHIAIDATLVALVAGFLALLARFLAPSPRDQAPRRSLYLAAALCGLATGAKFHAVLLLVPLIGAIFARADRAHLGRALKQAALCSGIAVIAVLAVNPGLLLDTVQVANDWGYTTRDYWRDSNPMYDTYKSVEPLQHLREASLYVITAALSPRPWLGLMLSGVAVLGFVSSWKRDWRATLAIGAFVPLYLLVVSRSGLIIARNYLPVLPVVAIFVMWGIEALLRGGGGIRALALGLCVLWTGINATHIVSAALTVGRPHDPSSLVREVRDYVQQHAEESFVVSPRLTSLALAERIPFRELPNARSDAAVPFDHFVYLASEYAGRVPGAPRLGYYQEVFGSREVNYDYYPDWVGRGLEQRAYVIDGDMARRLLEANPR